MNRLFFGFAAIGLLFALPLDASAEPLGQAYLPKLNVFLRAVQSDYPANGPIRVRITIENIGQEQHPFRFDWSENPFHHLELVVVDAQNRRLRSSTKHLTWRLKNEDSAGFASPTDASTRRVSLKPSERFSATIDLKDWVLVPDESRKVFVSGTFYPNRHFRRAALAYPIRAVSLNLSKNLDGVGRASFETNRGRGKGNPLEAAKKYPSSVQGVVAKHLNAQMDEDWEAYLETIHLQSYLSNSYPSTEFHHRFKTSRGKERVHVLNAFKAFLVRSLDYGIDSFEFEETVIRSNRRATVEALLKTKTRMQSPITRFNPKTGQVEESWKNQAEYNLREQKTYRFTLVRDRLGAWRIVQKDVNITRGQPDERASDANKPSLASLEEGFLPKLEPMLFLSGSSTLNASALATLQKVAEFLRVDAGLGVVLKGHADLAGDEESNFRLSLRRAQVAKSYLVRNGVEGSRVRLQAYGEAKPIYAEGHPNYPSNRRVEVEFERASRRFD